MVKLRHNQIHAEKHLNDTHELIHENYRSHHYIPNKMFSLHPTYKMADRHHGKIGLRDIRRDDVVADAKSKGKG